MGIRGMETYLEKCCNASYTVNVIELIHLYRDEHNCTPIIVIDGMSIQSHVYKFRNLSWILGGQMKEYAQTLRDFILALQNAGAELVFFFDGPCIVSKLSTWVKRRIDSLEKVYELFDDLKAGGSLHKHENKSFFRLLPGNLRLLTQFIASKCNCKVFSSVRECDLEISEYAAQNNCMAILAQDSDYVIFEGAKYYWSIKHFNMDRMTTLNYDRNKLAKSLGITTSHLPLLATLLGNDVISFESLRDFHFGLMAGSGSRNYHRQRIDFSLLFSKVAKIIKSLPGGFKIDKPNLQKLAQMALYDPSKYTLIEESILSYDFNAERNKDRGYQQSVHKNWSNILKELYENHKIGLIPSAMYDMMAYQRYNCATGLEDFRLNDLPACQTILKPLRQRLYGILLFEKPGDCEVEDGVVVFSNDEGCVINELVMCGPNSLDDFVPVKPIKPRVHHPGILALWSGKNMEHNWNIIGDAFDINPKEIKTLPQHLIVPGLTLRYLNSRVKIEKWELRAIVSSAALVRLYSAEYLSRIPIKIGRETRPIRLYTLVTRSYSTIIMFLTIGDTLPMEMREPTNYQDGKLFHYKYNEATHQNDFDLCDKKEVALGHFKQLMDFICQG